MENTIIRRTTQLVQDLRTLSILENDDGIRCLYNKNSEFIRIEVTFADLTVNEEHGRYQLVIYAFQKEFEKDNIQIDSNLNAILIDIML